MEDHRIPVFNRALSKLSEYSDEEVQSPLHSVASAMLVSPTPGEAKESGHDKPFLPALPLGKLGPQSESSKETVSSILTKSSGRAKASGSQTSRASKSHAKAAGLTFRGARTHRPAYWEQHEFSSPKNLGSSLQGSFEMSSASFIGEDDVEEHDERAEVLNMLKAARQKGYLLRELRLAQNGWRRSWTPFQPFRYLISVEDQLMSRFEKIGGVWGQDAVGDVVETRTKPPQADHEQLTSAYVLDGCTAGVLEDNVVDEIGPGSAVWIKLRNNVTLRMWAEGEHGRLKIQHLLRVVSISADRMKHLSLLNGTRIQQGQLADDGQVETYKIGVTPKQTMVSIAEDPVTMKPLFQTGHFELRGQDNSSVWSVGYGRRRDDILVVISRQWKGAEEQRKVVDKLWLAGAASTADLVRLIETPAPAPCDYLPRWTHFRGYACLLNYRIDVNGGKMIRSETLESLHKLCLMPLDGEVGYEVVHAEMFQERPASQQQSTAELRELLMRIWPDHIRAQQKALSKILHAGVRTIDDLHWMLTHDAPSGYTLPKRAIVGEKACMLNYRVDRIGRTLFRAETLLKMREKLDFRLTLSKGKLPKGSPAFHEELEEQGMKESERRALRRRRMIKNAENAEEHKDKLHAREVPRAPKTFGIPSQVLDMSFDDETSMLALARSDGVVSIIRCKGQPSDWKLCAELRRHRGAVNRCTFRPSHVDPSFPNHVMASAGSDGVLCIWDLDGLVEQPPTHARCIRVLQHAADEVLCCAFSRDGKRLARGSKEGICEVMEVSSWNPFNAVGMRPPTPTRDYAVEAELKGHERAVTCVTFSHDPGILASSSLDETVRLWSCTPHRRYNPMEGTAEDEDSGQTGSYQHWECTHVVAFPGPVSYITFSPKGMLMIANCLSDDRAYAWDLTSMLEKIKPWEYQVLDCGDDREEIVCTAAAMRSDCAWVAIGLDQGGVRLWNWDRNVSSQPRFQQTAQITDLPRHTARSCALSESARLLVTASSNLASPVEGARLSPSDKQGASRSPTSPASKSPSSPDLEMQAETTLSIFDLEESEFSPTVPAPPSQKMGELPPALNRVPSADLRRRQEEDERILELVSRLVESKSGAGMWTSEIVSEAEADMGVEFVSYLNSRSGVHTMHEVAMKHAQETIAFLVKSRRTMGGTKGPGGTVEDPPGSKEADVISDRQEARERITGGRPMALEVEDDGDAALDGAESRLGSDETAPSAPARGYRGRRASLKSSALVGGGGAGLAGLGLAGAAQIANLPRRRPSQESSGLELEEFNTQRRHTQRRRSSQVGAGQELPLGAPRRRSIVEEQGGGGRQQRPSQAGPGQGPDAKAAAEGRQQRRASVVLGFPTQLRGRRGSFAGAEFLRAESSGSGQPRREASASSAISREASQPAGGLCVWTDEAVEREREVTEARLTAWLCSWPKLFQIIWNSYVFRGHGASLHPCIAVGSFGRVAVKTERTNRAPTSALLFPPIRTGLTTEVEFMVEKMFHVPHDALRVGVCTGKHRIRAGEHASSHSGGWMFGCGTGMKFHSGEAHPYTRHPVHTGDKVAVVVDRPHCQVSIKINGVAQGKMFDHLPEHGDLYFVVDLVCVGESVSMTDAFVRQCWGRAVKRIPIDPLHFRCS